MAVAAVVAAIIGIAAPAAAAAKSGPVITSFSPRSGVIGTRIDIRGSGFSRVREVEIGGGRSDFRVRSKSSIVATVPASAASGRIIVVTKSGTTRSSANFTVRPSLQLSADAGPPDSPIQIWGAGFARGERISIDFGRSRLATTSARRGGQFGPVTIIVPAAAGAGRYWLAASGPRSSPHAMARFTVRLDDWPQFRAGPAMVGLNQGETALDPGDVAKLVQRWNLAGAQYVYSSPAVVGDTVYEATGEDDLDAINAATGALKWSFTVGPSADNDNSSPAVVGGTVYVGSFLDTLYAVNATTGKLEWSFAPPNDNGLVEMESPTVVGGVVYDTSNSGHVYAVNASTGAQLWTNYLSNQGIDGSPAFANGYLYVAGGDDIYALKASTGDEAWDFTTGNTVENSPAVSDGVVYAGSDDDYVYALNAVTGKKLWGSDPSGVTGDINYRINSSAAVAGGLVYVGCGDGYLYALRTATGKVAWSYPVIEGNDGIGFSSPAVADGVTYVGSVGGGLDALNSVTGKLLWTGTINWVVDSSPAVANGAVVVGSEGGGIYSFGLPGS
jgi:outer membrane protein assembly factor BamB